MTLKRATGFLWILVSVLSHSAEQSVYDEIKAKHGIKPSDYALPGGAIELTTINIFPSDHDEENGIYMPHPIELKGSSDGILYITDQRIVACRNRG